MNIETEILQLIETLKEHEDFETRSKVLRRSLHALAEKFGKTDSEVLELYLSASKENA